MSEAIRCERCGNPLPEAGGLTQGCPRCLLEMGLESPSATSTATDPGSVQQEPELPKPSPGEDSPHD